jgi:surface protein
MTDNEKREYVMNHKPNYSFDSNAPNTFIYDSENKDYQDGNSFYCSLLDITINDDNSDKKNINTIEIDTNKTSYEYKAHQYGISSFHFSITKNHINNNNNSNKKKTNVIEIAQNINSYEYKAHQDKINSIDNSLPKIHINNVNSYKKVNNNLNLVCPNINLNINNIGNKPHQDGINSIDNSLPEYHFNNNTSYKKKINNLSLVCPNTNINNTVNKPHQNEINSIDNSLPKNQFNNDNSYKKETNLIEIEPNSNIFISENKTEQNEINLIDNSLPENHININNSHKKVITNSIEITPNSNMNNSENKPHQDGIDSFYNSLQENYINLDNSDKKVVNSKEISPNINSSKNKTYQNEINSIDNSLPKNQLNNSKSYEKEINLIEIDVNTSKNKTQQEEINSIDNSIPENQINNNNPYKQEINLIEISANLNINNIGNKPHQDGINSIDNSLPINHINNNNSYKKEMNNLNLVGPNTNSNINNSGNKPHQDGINSIDNSLPKNQLNNDNSYKKKMNNLNLVGPNTNSNINNIVNKPHQNEINSIDNSLPENHINNDNSYKKKMNNLNLVGPNTNSNINNIVNKLDKDGLNSINNSLPENHINNDNYYKKKMNNLNLVGPNTNLDINTSESKLDKDGLNSIYNSLPVNLINNDNSYKKEMNNLSLIYPDTNLNTNTSESKPHQYGLNSIFNSLLINHINNDNSYKKKINLIWIDPNKKDSECKALQGGIINKFNIFFKTQTEEGISQIKEFEFEKTYVLINGSISEEFFSLLEKVIDEIKIFPVVIVYTNGAKFDLIKIINLKKFYFFDMNLVFDEFNQVKKQLSLENKYKSKNKQVIKHDNFDNCFTFQYVKESKDLILPLIFMESIEIPSQTKIFEFNEFLLDKCYNNQELFELIEQLITYQKIPLSILIKYWIRAYTIESPFYKEMNFTLMKKINNDFDIFIKTLYQGLKTKKIKSFIDGILYRGSKINLDEIKSIRNSLKNKNKDIPGCICFSKSFLSTSLDKNQAFNFMNKELKDNERKVLYIIQKKEELDEEFITNMDVQEYSKYKGEKEILFLPYSCFEIIDIKEIGGHYEINLSYIGKYKNKIDISQPIPENTFVKNILSANILDKIEMAKKKNQIKFEFKINKYIPKNLIKNHIVAVYDISPIDINKNIKIINYDEKNNNRIKNDCNLYLNEEKIEFNPNYTFTKPGKYTFHFEFNNLLTNAKKLFHKCDTLISLDFSKFKSNYIKDMSKMFKGCSKLEKINFSDFKTKDITKMKGVFTGCKSLKSLDLSSFDTDNVTDMSKMFKKCKSLIFLNIANFKTTKLKNVDCIKEIFEQCNENIFIYMSNTKMNQKSGIYKKLYYNIKYGAFSPPELEKIYLEIKNRGEKYISQNKISNALKCYEETFFIAEILNDNFKINESECNQSICYFYLNNIEKAFETLQICYSYFYKHINTQNDIIILCISATYFCLCKIALSHEKEDCITLINKIIKIISKEENLTKKKLLLSILIKILFNIDTLSSINNKNISNYSESELSIMKEKENEIKELKKLFRESFCKYLETDELAQWINSLDILYQKMKKLKCETEAEKVLFHLNKAKCLKNIKNKNDKDKKINISVNLDINNENCSLNSSLNKSFFKSQIIKTELGNKSNLLNNGAHIEDSYKEEESNEIKDNNDDLNINNISNKNKDGNYEYKLAIIKEIYKIINNYDNILKKGKEDIKLYEEKNNAEILKKFFKKAFTHIYIGELITKINMKSKGSKDHIFRLENATGHLLYLDGSIANKPKKDFDLSKIIKIKVGIETQNAIQKLNIVNLGIKNKNKPYKFISFILSANKKKEMKSLDLVFDNTNSARKWFYGLYYFFQREKMPYKICSCTKYVLKKIKSKMMNKKKIDMSQINEITFAKCLIDYFK